VPPGSAGNVKVFVFRSWAARFLDIKKILNKSDKNEKFPLLVWLFRHARFFEMGSRSIALQLFAPATVFVSF
jgi:hypothetical protein